MRCWRSTVPLTIEMFAPRRVVKTYTVVKIDLKEFIWRDEEGFTSEVDALTWADAMNRIDKSHAYYVREN